MGNLGSGFCGQGSWCLGPSLTLGFAGLGDRVHLVALVALTLEVSLVVDAGLAAGCRVLTLIYVWGGGGGGGKKKKKGGARSVCFGVLFQGVGRRKGGEEGFGFGGGGGDGPT